MKKLLMKKIDLDTYGEEAFFIINDLNADNFDYFYVIDECLNIYNKRKRENCYFDVKALDEEEIETLKKKSTSEIPEGTPEDLLVLFLSMHFEEYKDEIVKGPKSLELANKIISDFKGKKVR